MFYMDEKNMKKKYIVISIIIAIVLWLLIYFLFFRRGKYEQNITLQPVEGGLISIRNPHYNRRDSTSIIWFTIMDRNLWASEAWGWKNASKKTYWNHFQWGNNYGFDATKTDVDTTKSQINWTKNNNNPVFFLEERPWDDNYWWYRDLHGWMWDSSKNKNLWWWENDSEKNHWWLDNLSQTVKNRQWPCPEWFHIPSIWEWSKLMEIYNEVAWYNVQFYRKEWLVEFDEFFSTEKSDIPEWFIKYFKIPFAGDRNQTIWKLQSQNNLWYFWTSTPWHYASFGDDFLSTIDGGEDFHSMGFSIRCFSNVYIGE